MNIKQHLLDRYIDLNLHKNITIDEVNQAATFPLWNLANEYTGFQQYKPNENKTTKNSVTGRYFTYKKNKIAVWGTESWRLSNTLFITEGIFDAARFTNMGFSAIAVLSNSLEPTLINWLWLIGKTRPTVAICDNDKAGLNLAEYGNKSHIVTKYKDIGEASPEYLNTLLDIYT